PARICRIDMLFQIEMVRNILQPDQRLLDVSRRGIAVEVFIPGALKTLALVLGEAHAPLRLRRERGRAALGGIGDRARCGRPRRCAAGYATCVAAHAVRPLARVRMPDTRRQASKLPS